MKNTYSSVNDDLVDAAFHFIYKNSTGSGQVL